MVLLGASPVFEFWSILDTFFKVFLNQNLHLDAFLIHIIKIKIFFW